MRGAFTFEIKAKVRASGFRTELWRLASEEGFCGWLGGSSGVYRLHLEGEEERVGAFMKALPGKAPRHCRVEGIKLVARDEAKLRNPMPRMKISDLASSGEIQLPPPDRAICPDCAKAITDPSNRHFAHPFMSCAKCGPGLSIVRQGPFARSRTTLAAFPMCQLCKAESEDSGSFTHMAATLSCQDCGPQLFLANRDGQQIVDENPLLASRAALAAGKVLALRGVGGFRLAANAFDGEALSVLRKRKRRAPMKPFAVMARDLSVVKSYCECPTAAESLLLSSAAPIVVLRLRPKSEFPEPLPVDLLNPDGPTLGIMLPDSPLTKLLFESGLPGDDVPRFDMLVMSRGDRGGEPTCVNNEDAFERLGRIADLFLCHDREIALRSDDSVCAIRNGAPQVWRLGKGLSPYPVKLSKRLRRSVLAMGSDFKCALAMGSAKTILPSQHIGNIDSSEAAESVLRSSVFLPALLDSAPEAIAIDLNEEMHCSREGAALASKWGLPLVKIQHHFAHALSCMAENGLDNALALVFDGAGTGADSTIWGAELMEVSPFGFRRLASFAPVPLPGCDSAISRPTRQLLGRLLASGVKASPAWLERLGIEESEAGIWLKQCERRLNSPLCHSAGRLFDSVSVMLGLAPDFISYDGQTAIRLEYAALKGDPSSPAPDRIAKRYDFEFKEVSGFGLVDWAPTFRSFAEPPVIAPEEMPKHAVAFHCAVARAAAKMAQFGADKSDCREIVLSGGVFTNRLLCELVPDAIAMQGLTVYTHKTLPPNDGGLAVGQALFAGMNPS